MGYRVVDTTLATRTHTVGMNGGHPTDGQPTTHFAAPLTHQFGRAAQDLVSTPICFMWVSTFCGLVISPVQKIQILLPKVGQVCDPSAERCCSSRTGAMVADEVSKLRRVLPLVHGFDDLHRYRYLCTFPNVPTRRQTNLQ